MKHTKGDSAVLGRSAGPLQQGETLVSPRLRNRVIAPVVATFALAIAVAACGSSNDAASDAASSDAVDVVTAADAADSAGLDSAGSLAGHDAQPSASTAIAGGASTTASSADTDPADNDPADPDPAGVSSVDGFETEREPEFPEPAATVVPGRLTPMVYFDVMAVDEAGREQVQDASATRLSANGWTPRLVQLGCDSGAYDALGLPTDVEYWAVSLPFDSPSDAQLFAEQWGPSAEAVVEVVFDCAE